MGEHSDYTDVERDEPATQSVAVEPETANEVDVEGDKAADEAGE